MKDFHLLKLVMPGDFVISLRSFEGGIEIAHCRGIISPAYTVLEPRTETRRNYYRHFFKSPDFIRNLTLFVTGIREGQNIDYERLSRAYMPLPPEAEQEQIGRFLDWANGRLERAIRAKRKVIALLHEQKQAIIHKAVTQGLDPNVPKRDSGIPWLGEIPAHWEVVPLKFQCERSQNGATPSTSERRYYDNGTVPWFGPSSLGTGANLGPAVRHLNTSAFIEGKARLIRGPAILITVIGATAAKMGLLYGEGATNQQITAYELKKEIDPLFAIQQLRGAELWLKSTASTATIPILDSGIVSRLPLAVPPLAEQNSIVTVVESGTSPLTTAIARYEREITLLREYRTRLVADVVTGKLDVREVTLSLPEEDVVQAPEDAVDETEGPELEELEG